MRVILDLQACQSVSRRRGIGRYSLSLAKAIVRNAGNHEIWIVLSDLYPETVDDIRADFADLLPLERIVVFSLPGPASALMGFPWRERAAELIREHAIAELAPDVVHISSLLEGYTSNSTSSVKLLDQRPVVALTHYDLIQYLEPKIHLAHHGTRDFYYRKVNMLRHADLLLAISEYSRDEVIRELGVAGNKVVNISCGISESFDEPALSKYSDASVASRYGLSRPFVMSTGIAEPRKNLEGLVTAYGQLPASLRGGHQLLLICQATEADRERYARIAVHAGLQAEDLVLTGFVPDDDLVALYKMARLFVFPSFQEGFGLPVIEAMRCGTPVIGSRATSVPEAVGREDALFDPHNPVAIAALMQRALTDDAFRESLCSHGFSHSRRFSWDQSALRALAAFEHAVLSRQPVKQDSTPTYDVLLQALVRIPFPCVDADLVAASSAIALNKHAEGERQLLVDVSVLSGFDAKSGIQRVTRAIAAQLLAAPPVGYMVRLVSIDRDEMAYRYADTFCEALGFDTHVSGKKDDWVESYRGDYFLGLDLTADTVPAARAWFAAQHRRGVKIYFVVYDLLPVYRPEWFSDGIAKCFPAWLEAIGNLSDGLIGISKDVVDGLKRLYEQNPPKRSNELDYAYFHLGADLKNTVPTTGFAADAQFVLQNIGARPSFLMVGTVEPRKGHVQTLAAFGQLWQQGVDVNLIIVGKPGWHQGAVKESILRHPEIGKRLLWLQGISDEYLEAIYAASTCLLAASEGEGFGLPLVEAAQHDLPILARDLPVFKEIAGEHASYFHGDEASALATSVRDWLDAYKRRQVPLSGAMQLLTWQESAEQLLHAMFGDSDEPSKVF